MTMMTNWKITSFNRSINYKWPFSIAIKFTRGLFFFLECLWICLGDWDVPKYIQELGDLGRSASGDPELYQIESQVPRP